MTILQQDGLRAIEQCPHGEVPAYLRDLASWYFACPDAVTEEGMRLLGCPIGEDPKVISGESGAVTAGLLHRLCTRPALADLREKMGLDETSVVLLISTEGDTDPEAYQTILANH